MLFYSKSRSRPWKKSAKAVPKLRKLGRPSDSLIAESPCVKSFSQRSGGPDQLSFGQQIRSTTLTWSGAISAKRISPSERKAPWSNAGTIAPKNTMALWKLKIVNLVTLKTNLESEAKVGKFWAKKNLLKSCPILYTRNWRTSTKDCHFMRTSSKTGQLRSFFLNLELGANSASLVFFSWMKEVCQPFETCRRWSVH